MDERLIDELGRSWQRGWQPRDLMWVVRNEVGADAAEALASAIQAEAARYEGPPIDERWQAQLDLLAREYPVPTRSDHTGGRLRFILEGLPSLPLLIPPPGEVAGLSVGASGPGRALDDRILTRVRALLAKAESTTFTEEAEALSAKAHELMARHAIDQVLLAAGSQQGEPEAQRIHIENPYLNPKVLLLSRVAQANRCRAVWAKGLRMATVFGFRSDIEATEVLFTSLLVQATTAMLAAEPDSDFRIKSFRSSFLVAYGYRIGERLAEINDETVSDADDGSLLPVLASREAAVEAATEAVYPNLGALNVSMSNGGGILAGHAAADRADLHRQRVGGVSGSLDRT